MLRFSEIPVDFSAARGYAYSMMIENSTPMNENAFGSYGEFVDTPDWSTDEWAAYDAQIAEEMAEYDNTQDLYWEAEADLIMAQYDVPDFDLY